MNIEAIKKIKREMTQGEFGHINKFVANRPFPERMANTAARSIAVNETFVKNINPLKVEQMLKALEAVDQHFTRIKSTSPCRDIIKQALKDSRIQTDDTKAV